MTFYSIEIPVKSGETIRFPDKTVVVLDSERDKYLVEIDGEKMTKHIDWFYEEAAKADWFLVRKTAM